MTLARLALAAFAAVVFTACATDGQVDSWVANGEGLDSPAIAESTYGIETHVCPDQHLCGGDCTHIDCDGGPGNYYDCRYCGSVAEAVSKAQMRAMAF